MFSAEFHLDDVQNITIELSPNLDDYTALGLPASAFQPGVREIADQLSVERSEPFTIYKIIDPASTDLVDITILMSFRTPYAKPYRVTDQLPVCFILARNVPYQMLNHPSLTSRLIKFGSTHAKRQYPCCQYDANNIKYQLTDPRMGYWHNNMAKYTDLIVYQAMEHVQAIQDLTSENGNPSVYLSMSFLISLETNTASDTATSTVSDKDMTCPDDHRPLDASSVDVTIWMNRLQHLASLPESFDTLAKYAQLAQQIHKVCKSTIDNSKSTASPVAKEKAKKPKTPKESKDVRSLIKRKIDLRENLSKRQQRSRDLRRDLERRVLNKYRTVTFTRGSSSSSRR